MIHKQRALCRIFINLLPDSFSFLFFFCGGDLLFCHVIYCYLFEIELNIDFFYLFFVF